MPKCRELSRLSKVPRFTSILWRNQTPGSPQSVFDNSYVKLAKNASSNSNPSNGSSTSLLDPFHPATKLKPQQLPLWQADGIKIKLVPMALLQKPISQCSGNDPFTRNFVSWAERIQHAKKAGMKVVSSDIVGAQNQRIEDCDLFPKSELGNKRLPAHRSVTRGAQAFKDLALKKLARRIPMSYLTATSKERMGSKTHMRRRITTRIKTALNLIVTRGAYGDQREIQNEADQLGEDESKIKRDPLPHLKFDNEEAGEKWIMQGWSYIFYPTTEIYNMPYPKLVNLLRQCLKSLYKTATELERRWLKEALLPQPLLRYKYQETNPSRANKDSRGKPTKPAVEPLRQVEMSDPSSSSLGSAYHIVEKPQKSGPNRVRRVGTPTTVKPELLEARLLSGLAIIREKLGERVCLSSSSASKKYQQTDPSRRNVDTREKPTKQAAELSTHEHQVEMSDPSSSMGSENGVVKKAQKSAPNDVHRVESPTAVKPELWESQLLSGLAIMQERLGKRVPLSTRRFLSETRIS